MKPILGSSAGEWVWTRPKVFRRLYELRAGDDLVATLESPSLFSSAAIATTSDGQSLLRHTGLLRGRVLLTDLAGGEPRIRFQPGWFGAGTVHCSDGGEWTWKRSDFWGRTWCFESASGTPLLSFVRRPAWFRTAVAVEPSPEARRLAELPDLALLGFYLLLLMQRQAQAAAA